MADLYLEYDYLSKKKQRRRALRKRPRWPFVLLGFFIGFITLPAVIAAAVLLFVNRPVEKTVNSIDKITNAGLYETLFGTEDKVGILDDRYGEMALKDVFSDIAKIVEKGADLTLEDLNEISPQVEKSIENLVQSAEEKNINLDKQELMATPLNKLGDLLMGEVKEIELGEVLLSTSADIFKDEVTGAILKNLFFGKAGVNYTENEGVITMLPISYDYDEKANTFVCVDGMVYNYDGSVWAAENGQYLVQTDVGFDLYSTETGAIVYHLQASLQRSFTTYIAVTVNNDGAIVPVLQKSLALGDFMNKDSNPMDIIGKLELGTLLGITTKGQAEADGNAMLVSLAYGSYGEDFYYDGEQDYSLIIPKKGGKPFTTLNDLMGSPDEILNGMKLGSLLGITTRADAENDSNAMLIALAYGTQGIDFTFDENDLIVPIGDKKFTTLGDLMNSPDAILNDMRLGSLLGITTKADAEKEGNGMLVALAYGTYGINFTYDENDLIIPFDDKQSFTTLGDLINNPDDILNSIQLGSMLGITTKKDAQKDENKMLVALAYGTEGVDFTYDGEGEDSLIIPVGGKEFTTLGDLMNNSDQVLNGIRLGSLLGITTKYDVLESNSDMMVALAYGTYGVDFTYDDNGLIIPIGDKTFTTLGDLINSPDTILNGIQLGSLLGITTHEDAIQGNNSMLVALAYGTYGVDFQYACNDVVCYDNHCTNADCVIVKISTSDREFTTLDNLINNSDQVLNGIRLGTLLGITTKADVLSGNNDMMIAIAYGTYGVDFEYDGESPDALIIPVGNKSFTTLGDLINSPDTILNGIQLGSLLGITTHADAINDNNKMLVALAYGTYGVDYHFYCNGAECKDDACADPNCSIRSNPESDRAFTTLDDLMNNSDEVLNGLPLGTLLGITTKADVESGDNDMMVAIAYGTYGVDFDYDANGYIVSVAGGKAFATLGDLVNTPNDVLQSVQLGTLLGISTKADVEASDSLLVSLAYGTYGVDFEYDVNDKIVRKDGGKEFTTVQMLMNSDEVSKIFEDIPLSSIFTVDIFAEDADPLTASLVYGTNGKHYEIAYDDNGQPYVNWLIKDHATGEKYKQRTFGELRDGDLTDIVNDLKICDVFDVVESGPNASPKLLIAIKDWKISDLSNGDNIQSLQLKQVIDIDQNDSFLVSIGEWKIGEIGQDKIKELKLNQVLNIDNNDTFLKAIGEWEIGEIGQEKIKELKLSDVIAISDSDTFLKSIGQWKIGEIGQEKIKELQLKDVIAIDENDEFLSAMGEWKIGEINDEQIKTIKISNIISVNESDTGLLATLVKKGWTIADMTEDNIQSLKLKEVLPNAIGNGENDFFGALADTPLSQINADYIKNSLTIGQALGINSDNESEYGILVQFADTKIKDFNEATLKSTLTIGDVVATDHPILNALKDKTLDAINEDLIQEELEKLTLAQIIGEMEEDESLHPLFDTLKNETIGDITKGNLIDGITVGDAIGLTTTTDPILKQIIDLKLGELKNSGTLKDRINGLQLSELLEDLPDEGILGEMRTWKIGDINKEKVDSIKLSSIFTVEEGDTGLLATLVNKTDENGDAWTISHLTSANINTLTIDEVIGGVEDNFVLKHLSGSTLGDLANNIQNISVVNFFADSVYVKADDDVSNDRKDSEGFLLDEDGNRIIAGTWKYLLKHNPDAGHDHEYIAPEDYKVTDMTLLIENMHNNIETATLHELHDDGIIPHLGDDGTDTLHQPLVPLALTMYASQIAAHLGLSEDQDIRTMDIGDLTILQVSRYLGYLLGVVFNPGA